VYQPFHKNLNVQSLAQEKEILLTKQKIYWQCNLLGLEAWLKWYSIWHVQGPEFKLQYHQRKCTEIPLSGKLVVKFRNPNTFNNGLSLFLENR
jgi:hypothetical protein